MKRSLFDEYGLDPTLTPAEITTYFRGRIENGPQETPEGEAAREALREAWNALVRHPKDRLLEALLSTPPRSPLAAKPPPKKRKRAKVPRPLEVTDFALIPPLAALLPLEIPEAPLHLDPLLFPRTSRSHNDF